MNFLPEKKKIRLIATGGRHSLILLDDLQTLFSAGRNEEG